MTNRLLFSVPKPMHVSQLKEIYIRFDTQQRRFIASLGSRGRHNTLAIT